MKELVIIATWEDCWKDRITSKFHPYNQIEKALYSLQATPCDIVSGSWTHMEETWLVAADTADIVMELMKGQFEIYDLKASIREA